MNRDSSIIISWESTVGNPPVVLNFGLNVISFKFPAFSSDSSENDEEAIEAEGEKDWNLSKSTKLNDAKTVDPGKVEIIPRKRVTLHVRTCCWAQTDTKGERKVKY